MFAFIFFLSSLSLQNGPAVQTLPVTVITASAPRPVWVCSGSRELRIGSGTVRTCEWEAEYPAGTVLQ